MGFILLCLAEAPGFYFEKIFHVTVTWKETVSVMVLVPARVSTWKEITPVMAAVPALTPVTWQPLPLLPLAAWATEVSLLLQLPESRVQPL